MVSPMIRMSLQELLELVDNIPIISIIRGSGKFSDGTNIDSRVYVQSISSPVSFRDIIQSFREFLKHNGLEEVLSKQCYNQLLEIGCSYPPGYLLFDFCLAALECDYLDSRLYLSHAFNLLRLHLSFSLLLSVIVNERLAEDRDVRQFLVLLARRSEPRNARLYLSSYGDEFKKRYEIYLQDCKSLIAAKEISET